MSMYGYCILWRCAKDGATVVDSVGGETFTVVDGVGKEGR